MEPIRLLAKNAILQYLQKWQNQLNVTVKGVPNHNPSLEIDYDGALFLDPISFFRLPFSNKRFYSVTFQRSDTQIQRILSINPSNDYNGPTAQISSTLFFRLFSDMKIENLVIKEILPYESEIQLAKEVWLSPIKTIGYENGEFDDELIEYFQTSRLLHSKDIFSIERQGISRTDKFYFMVNLKDSPSYVDETTKIFQSPTISTQYPRQKISTTFVPSGIYKIVEDAVKVLDGLFRDVENKSSMVISVLAGNFGFGKDLSLDLIADQLCVNRLDFDCQDLWNVERKSTEGVVNGWLDKITNHQPCICELKNSNVLNGNPSIDLESGSKILGTLANSIQAFCGRAAIFITSNKSELTSLPQILLKLAHFEFICDDLNETNRCEFVKFVQTNYKTNFSMEWLIDSIRGLVLSELSQLLAEAIIQANSNDRQFLQKSDFEFALEQRNRAFGEALGVPKIPSVTWEDVGGLEDVKQLIAESLKANLNLNRPVNMRRSGVVLWGPPGCGKTLIAKAVANEFKMTFLSVKGPELLNQYIGQSEHNLRQVFEKARLASPSIIFFDELDSLAPSRGVAGDSSGVMDRMVSMLLSELDELQAKKDYPVFVMGATNRPDLLDKCLLSPGRFDKLIEVKMATDLNSKICILKPICKKVNLADNLTIEEIVKECPEEMSGAELSALISNAAMHAIRSIIVGIEQGNERPESIRIEKEHIRSALEGIIGMERN